MNPRDEMLARIRAALKRDTATPEPPPARLRIPEMSPEARLEAFVTALANLAAKPHLAESADHARAILRDLIGSGTWVASRSPVLASLGIPATETADWKAACASAQFGLTGADYALADTGTLVTLSATEARLASLLPPVHIAVLERSRILTGLDELLTILPDPASLGASTVLITGPSRTADIEQILVRGVHGPGELHVIICG